MNAKLQSAEELKRLSKMLKGILALDEDLERCGSLEQAMAETENRLQLLQGREEEQRAVLAELEEKRDVLTRGISEARQDAEQKAVAIVAQAEAEGRTIVEGCKDHGKKLIATAETKERQTRERIVTANHELTNLAQRIEEAQKQLDSLQDRIQTIKQEFAKL